MADKLTRKRRSWNMSRIKASNTSPEILLRKALFKKGLRYRLNYKLEGKPDIVIPWTGIAIFVNGCFWHQHGCTDTYRPKTNRKFWNTKLDQNIQRDCQVKKLLAKKGWHVISVWECEINKDLNRTTYKVMKKAHSIS